MSHTALTYLVLGALAAVLLAVLGAAVQDAWRSWRAGVRSRRGHRGEQRARVLLERAGWQVLEQHPPVSLRVRVDGQDVLQPLCADYLCQRGGRVLPVEVKTGNAADPCSRATRRQLLEYAVAYGSGATLFVDADAGEVQEVSFVPARAAPWGVLTAALLAGVVLGVLGARWLQLG